MLMDRRAYATIPASDFQRAKDWYREKLGLTPVREDPMGAVYKLDASAFMLYPSRFAGTAQNTAMSFSSTDVSGDVAKLRSRGVVFEEYDFPGLKTENGIAKLGEYSGAWFKDSEGNILAISDDIT